MTFTVKIAQSDAPVTVEMGETILAAALNAGVPYPHGCQSGNCGACKSRLVSGEIEMSPYSEFALTEEERAAGLVLACRAVPWSDAEIAWLDEGEMVAHPIRRMTCRVTALDRVTHDITRIRLGIEAGGPFVFSAGQYCRVTFDGMPPRDYSMANFPRAGPAGAPRADVPGAGSAGAAGAAGAANGPGVNAPGANTQDQTELEFHIRHVPGGAASGYAAETLAVGDTVAVEGPYGSSWLREDHRGPLLALAGGSGLAPIKSIVETALARGMDQPIHLYFGVRSERDLYLMEHFEALCARHGNLHFVPILSEPDGPTERRTGLLHEAVSGDFSDSLVGRHQPAPPPDPPYDTDVGGPGGGAGRSDAADAANTLDGFKAYLAGPPPMVEAATKLFTSLGMRRDDIHADAFYTEAEKAELESET